jgi:alpha-tubulin suppressor-like RCC1 family protein
MFRSQSFATWNSWLVRTLLIWSVVMTPLLERPATLLALHPSAASSTVDVDPTQLPVAGLQSATALAAGAVHTCAVTTSGGVKCWGGNILGQLGDGTTTDRWVPVDVSGLMSSVTALAAGQLHTCAATASGGVKCWGSNNRGQLGDGTTTVRWTPVDVIDLTSGATALVAGWNHTCALMTGGGVKCWGSNSAGQLGDGTTTDRWTPVDVSGLTSGVTALVAGSAQTCALTIDGGIKCWGYNYYGQLGDGTTTDRWTPVDVSGLTSGVTALAAGTLHTCAVTTGGGVKCWGDNSSAQLGDGTATDRWTPVDVSGLTSGVTALSEGGGYHTCARMTSGGVKCWGSNSVGELGDGTTTIRWTPVDVIGLTSGVATLVVGDSHTCARMTGSGVKCWGWNNHGQLGDGTMTDRWTPVDVIGFVGGGSFSISGRIATFGGIPISGVSVSAGFGGSAMTDASGYYTITNTITGTYMLTPTKQSYIFAPITRTVSVPPDAAGLDFIWLDNKLYLPIVHR